ncbi:TPA: AAA family ATPase [Streptococcus pneumoniae]|nr:AAA family ATPase [Streptococcus pneumoniae]HEV5987727.1 AAA family ATPase [Streptococcus pneumoniae]HEV5989613.1 AAA family ATPase [Streptococcus pneumoniae]HEV6545654.1 AAA family ATPase [Streptococcus pneumoniae]HEV6814304.1 AAA family ATPase [Streptococcus pneumoniae]
MLFFLFFITNNIDEGEKMKVENISYRVDHRILFDNISFDTLSSGVTLITGKNGTGKSTLL